MKVAPNGIVKILLLRDDLRNLAMFNTHDINMGNTMSNINSEQDSGGDESPSQIKLGPTKKQMQPCQRRAPHDAPCMRPFQGKPVQIITRPLNPPPAVPAKPCGKLR